MQLNHLKLVLRLHSFWFALYPRPLFLQTLILSTNLLLYPSSCHILCKSPSSLTPPFFWILHSYLLSPWFPHHSRGGTLSQKRVHQRNLSCRAWVCWQKKYSMHVLRSFTSSLPHPTPRNQELLTFVLTASDPHALLPLTTTKFPGSFLTPSLSLSPLLPFTHHISFSQFPLFLIHGRLCVS